MASTRQVRVKDLTDKSVRIITGLSHFALTSEVLPSACTGINHNSQNTAFVCSTDVVRQYVKQLIIQSIESLPKWLEISVHDFSRFHICLKVAGKIINIFLVLSARELKGRTFKNLFIIGSEKHADKIRKDIKEVLNRVVDIVGVIED